MARKKSSAKNLSLCALYLGCAWLVGCAAAKPSAPQPEAAPTLVAIRVIRLEPLEEVKEEPALANEPDSADRRSRLGDVRVQAGQMDEAIQEYQRSIELDPKNAQRHFKIGLVYQAMGRFEDALGAYQQATRLEPQSAWAHAAVSIVYAKMGNQDAALAEYQVVKGLNVELAKGVLEVLGRYGGVHDV